MKPTCPTCGSDRVTTHNGVLHDVAVYPNARYLRGPHAPTCAATMATRKTVSDERRAILNGTADTYRSLIAKGMTHLQPRLDEVEAELNLHE